MDVLCVGQASFDLVFEVDHHPGPDEKCEATEFLSCGGGPAANAAVAVARLGGKAAFAGYLGLDLFGEKHLAELAAEGVATGLIVRAEAPTPVSAVLVKPDGSRSLANYRRRTPKLPAGIIDFDSIRPKVILFDGHEPFLSVPLARLAREQGIPTVLDAGSLHPGTRDLAGLVDYLIASERFAREFSGQDDEFESLDVLHRHAPRVAITLGKRGLLWQDELKSAHLPAFPVKAVDTTGAGDAFHGAFAAFLAQGTPWRDCLVYAAAAAALCCTRMGARPGLARAAEITAFLRRHRGW